MILVYSENNRTAFELISQARRFAGDGGGVAAVVTRESEANLDHYAAYGAGRVYAARHPALDSLRPEPVAAALAQVAEAAGADTIFLDSTRRGKELAGRLAQRLGAACVTDATAVRRLDGSWETERAGLGGNTVVTERLAAGRAVIAVMPKTFEADERAGEVGEVVEIAVSVEPSRARVVERRPKTAEGANLEDAQVIVCAGRGVAKREDLALVEELAAVLHGEVACTRSLATDYQWLPEERIVGLSGKRASPRLYLGVGLSGQIQHTVGIAGARIVAAINTDKEAPIFQMADYGIVGDLYQVVPALLARLKGTGG